MKEQAETIRAHLKYNNVNEDTRKNLSDYLDSFDSNYDNMVKRYNVNQYNAAITPSANDLKGTSDYLKGGKYTDEQNKAYTEKAKKYAADKEKLMSKYQKDSDEYANADILRQYYSSAADQLDGKSAEEVEEWNAARKMNLPEKASFADYVDALNRMREMQGGAQRRGHDSSAYDKAVEMLKEYTDNVPINSSDLSQQDRQALYRERKKERDNVNAEIEAYSEDRVKDENYISPKDKTLVAWLDAYDKGTISNEHKGSQIDVLSEANRLNGTDVNADYMNSLGDDVDIEDDHCVHGRAVDLCKYDD